MHLGLRGEQSDLVFNTKAVVVVFEGLDHVQTAFLGRFDDVFFADNQPWGVSFRLRIELGEEVIVSKRHGVGAGRHLEIFVMSHSIFVVPLELGR